MSNNYLNIYNNLVKLTRNKELYKDFNNQDTFSDRLIFFLLHFAFFLKVYKENNECTCSEMQNEIAKTLVYQKKHPDL